VDEDDLSDRGGGQQGSAGSVPRLLVENGGPDGDQSPAATRITLRPRDPRTGQEIEKCEAVKGYEYSCGQFLNLNRRGAEGGQCRNLFRLSRHPAGAEMRNAPIVWPTIN
jgi:hypothetical protein